MYPILIIFANVFICYKFVLEIILNKECARKLELKGFSKCYRVGKFNSHFFLVFNLLFWKMSNLQKRWKDSIVNTHTPSIYQKLTFAVITLCLSTHIQYIHTFFLAFCIKFWKVTCKHHGISPQNTLACIFWE